MRQCNDVSARELYVARPLRLCGPIEKGAVLGHLLSDRDLSCKPVRSPVRGYLWVHGVGRPDTDVALPGRHPCVEKGERLATVAWPRK